MRETIVCLPVQLSRSLLSLCMCVSAVHVLPWGLNGFPTWSIVSRSLPFHPLAPRTPIRPSTPSRSFPFSRRAASGAATFPLSHFISRALPKNRESREAGARRGRATRPPCTPSSDPLFPFVLLFLFRAVSCFYILAVLLLLPPRVSLVFPSFFGPFDPVAVPCHASPTSLIRRSISAASATCQLSFQHTVLSSAGQSSTTSIF